jgi:membrane-associated phospholipid phosphatase
LAPVPVGHPDDRGYLPIDIIILGYLTLTGLLLVISPHTLPGKMAYTTIHFTLLGVIAFFRFLPRTTGPTSLTMVRHWYPIACLPLFYSALRLLNRMVTTEFYDDRIVALEKAVFGYLPSQELYHLLPSRLLSEFTHFSYMFYLVLIPLVAVLVFWRGRLRGLTDYAMSICLTFIACYAVFITFPVMGPYHYFGPIDPAAKPGVVCHLVHGILEKGSSLGTAFPSSHVAAAFCIWGVSRPYLGRLSWAVLAIAAGILVGTVYGGFHYAVDSLAGLPIGLAGGLLGPRVQRALARRLRYVAGPAGSSYGDSGSPLHQDTVAARVAAGSES